MTKQSLQLSRMFLAFSCALLPFAAAAQGSPALTVSTKTLTFAPTAVGAISAGQTVTVTNTGTTPVDFTGSGSGDFVVTDNCLGHLEAGQSCFGTVAFRPLATGPRSTTFDIFVAGTSAPIAVQLSGIGTDGALPQPLLFSSSTLDLGFVAVGALSAPVPVTVTNPNDSPVTLIGSGLAGANAADFQVNANTCPTTLAAHEGCTFSILFTPKASGERSAAIQILTTANAAGQTLLLSGSAGPLVIDRLTATLDSDQLGYQIQVLGSASSQGCTLQSGSTRLPTASSNTGLSATIELPQPTPASQFSISEVCDGANGAPIVSNVLQLFLNPNGVKTVGQVANDIAWDPVHNLIYASVPGSAAQNPNSIVVIDPADGTIKTSVYAGIEPNVLAVSDDGQFLYVSIEGASGVQRFTLPGLSPDIFVPLIPSTYPGLTVALALEVAPGAPHTWAVSTGNRAAATPESLGEVIVYDDGLARPDGTGGYLPNVGSLSIGSIVWGKDASVLYGTSNDMEPSSLYVLPVDGSGIDLSSYTTYEGVFDPFFQRIHFDKVTQFIYQDTGMGLQSAKGIDPSNGFWIGSYEGFGALVPDGANGKVFFAPFSDIPFFNQFNQTFFSDDIVRSSPIGSVPAPGLKGNPGRIIRFGENGLAVNTLVKPDEGTTQAVSGGEITLYHGPFVH